MQALRHAAIIAALTVASASLPAQGAVTVIGGSDAVECYRAALIPSPTTGLEHCDAAILNGGLPIADLAGTYVNRGILRTHKRMNAAALEDFNRALALRPGLGEAFINRGNVHFIERRYSEALADYERAVAAPIGRLEAAHYNRGLALEGLRRFDDAEADFRKALALDPEFAEAAEKVALYDRRRARLQREAAS